MRQVRAGSKRGFDENQDGHAKVPKFDSEVFHFLYAIQLYMYNLSVYTR